jgi:AcrR family transcriptional regulator
MTVDKPDHIRSVATQLFARHGYEGVSLQAVAERVGVTKQTLLYHYPSKDVLRRSVLDQVFSHWRERLPQMLEAVTSGHGRFEALTEELIRFFESDLDWARLLTRELLDNPKGMRELIASNLRPWIMLVAQYIREGQQGGLIYEDVDPEAYVLEVVILVIAVVAGQAVLSAGLSSPKPGAMRAELTRMTRTALFKHESAAPSAR